MKYYICPSILSADLAILGDTVKRLVDAGVEWIQVDVMDGHFVENMTYGPSAVEVVRRFAPKNVVVDAHLMIENPEKWAVSYCEAGADVVSVHVEATRHLHGVIQNIHKAKTKAGVALNPGTPLCAVEEVLGDVELIVVMSVNPGFGGQKFIKSSLDKVRRLRAMLNERGFAPDIQVDGGIKVENVAEVARAGANAFVMGSGVFDDEDAKKGNFKPILQRAYSALAEFIEK